MRTRINSTLAFPQQSIEVPVDVIVGGDTTTATTSANNRNNEQQPQRLGWLGGVLWTLAGLLGLAFVIALLMGVWRSMPDPVVTVDPTEQLTRIESKLDSTAIDAKTAAIASTEASGYAKSGRDILIPTAKRVNQMGKVIDRMASVTYDSDGNIDRVITIDSAIVAANRAVIAAEARPTYVIKKVEVPAAVDMSETNSRLSAIEKALAAQPQTPTLERVEVGQQ